MGWNDQSTLRSEKNWRLHCSIWHVFLAMLHDRKLTYSSNICLIWPQAYCANEQFAYKNLSSTWVHNLFAHEFVLCVGCPLFIGGIQSQSLSVFAIVVIYSLSVVVCWHRTRREDTTASTLGRRGGWVYRFQGKSLASGHLGYRRLGG